MVWRADAVAGTEHAVPGTASADGCGWPATLSIPVAEDWRSGFHSVRLTAGDDEAYAFFAVRPAASPAPILLVLSTSTANAYNDWGGPSLYTGGTRVSFERPLARGFLAKPEPAARKAQAVPDREALGYFGWAEEHGVFPVERRRRLVDMGASVRGVGRTRGLRDRRRDLPGPRGASRGARRASAPPVGRTRRVLVLGDARHRRGVPRRRRQRCLLQREHVLVAGAVRRRSSRDDVLQVPSSRGSRARNA